MHLRRVLDLYALHPRECRGDDAHGKGEACPCSGASVVHRVRSLTASRDLEPSRTIVCVQSACASSLAMLEQSLSTAGAVHVVVPAAAAGARLQRFAAAAFREHCLAAARQQCASSRWVALPSNHNTR